MADDRDPVAPVLKDGGRRKLGLLRGKMRAAPDAWDPDPELERLFHEGDPSFRSILDDGLDGPAAGSQGDGAVGSGR